MVQKPWKILSGPFESFCHSQGWFWKCGPNPNPQPHLDAGLQHLISTLCLIKKTGGRRWRSWSFSLMTYDYPYDTVSHQRKNNISLIWNKLQNLETKSSWKRLYIPLKVQWQSCLPGVPVEMQPFSQLESSKERKWLSQMEKNNRFVCHYSTIIPYIYIYMYHIVPIVCVNSWLVSTNITFCAPNLLVTESQYLQHFLWSKKLER